MSEAVYMDHNATTPVRAAARDAAVEALSVVGNPSSAHGFGRAAHRRLADARDRVAALVETPPETVVFTSGGTEANALAVIGGGRERVLVSAIEHASVLEAAPRASRIAVTSRGTVDLNALESLLTSDRRPALVSVMLANNETGVLQPVTEVVAIARRHGALVHCDAAQAAGRIAVSMSGLGVDMLTLSAHKLGGLPGTGALVVREGLTLAPLLRGGGQERRRRAGTENVPGIAAFGAAAEVALDELEEFARLGPLRDRLDAAILERTPRARVLGGEAARLPNTTCVTMPGVAAETQVMAFDLAGVAVGAGAACSSGKVAASSVLAAMGVPDHEARTAIRVSLGWTSDASHVDRFLAAWDELWERVGQQAAAA